MKRNTRSTLLTLLALSTALPALADRPVQHAFPANPDVEIEIEILSGNVEIVGWGQESVEIDGTIGEQVEQLDISVDGRDAISIEVELPDGRHSHGNDVAADLRISVPAGAWIEVETLSANVRATGLKGSIEVESMSGSVTLSGDLETLEAETISGDVRFEGQVFDIEVESVSGKVYVDGAESSVALATVNGNIYLNAGSVAHCDLESVSGDVDFTGSLVAHADVDIEVHSSNVTLSLPAATSAQFEIDTFSGEIENAFGIAANRESRWMTTKTLDFTLGDGSASVNIESFSGSVTLVKQ